MSEGVEGEKPFFLLVDKREWRALITLVDGVGPHGSRLLTCLYPTWS